MATTTTALSQPDGLTAIILVRQLASSGEALAIRQKAGLSQADIARAVGVAASAVARWEKGQRIPRSAAALRYGQALVALRDRG